MVRKSGLQPWPAVIDEVEQAEPVMTHWAAARGGSKAKLWPASPTRLSRYLDNILTAHVLSARGDVRS
jgi:hypothetical protein